MYGYIQHLFITIWRKKSMILTLFGFFIFFLFALSYVRNGDKDLFKTDTTDNNVALVQKLIQTDNIKFVESSTIDNKLFAISSPAKPLDMANTEMVDDEQQLGIPYVNLDTKNPYIPPKRIVHFDLKGAPPTITYFKKMLGLIKTMGATGILLEYEDMFPYEGNLKTISAGNAYTRKQIEEILECARQNQLEVIPLIQTFGHLEFALKHKDWGHLREVEGSPQALCPSRNATMDFLKEMIDQIIAMHQGIQYIHIGCDEVFQMGECEICRLEIHETLFLRHVVKVATYIRTKYPHLKVIIWDDMLRHLFAQSIEDIKLGELVEPMIWVYAEDIYRFVQPQIWEKYTKIFPTAWCASAFKGAFGETLYVPDARRHLENNLRWLDVMSQQTLHFKNGLRGLVLTGWQRYDHFAVLCEVFPAGLPSLALSLIAVTHGFFNSTLKHSVLSSLSCPQPASSRHSNFLSLHTDPFLWDKFGRCMFPGSPLFRLTYRLHSAESEVLDFMKNIKYKKGWLTDYNVRHKYSAPLRVDEEVADLPRVYHGVLSLVRASTDAFEGIFDNFTISEWIEQRIYPYLLELERVQNESAQLKKVEYWNARPVPSSNDLKRFGVPVP